VFLVKNSNVENAYSGSCCVIACAAFTFLGRLNLSSAPACRRKLAPPKLGASSLPQFQLATNNNLETRTQRIPSPSHLSRPPPEIRLIRIAYNPRINEPRSKMSTTDETPVAPPAQEAPAQEVPAQEEVSAQEPEDSLEKAQVDGSAVDPGHGSELADTKFSVEVKLADLQADPNNPLYSAKSFEELQL
jgi:hypothetical protein